MARHHLVLCKLDGQIQRRRAVALDPLRGPLREPRNKLLQHHLVDDIIDAAFPGQQPSAAGVPELAIQLAEDQMVACHGVGEILPSVSLL